MHDVLKQHGKWRTKGFHTREAPGHFPRHGKSIDFVDTLRREAMKEMKREETGKKSAVHNVSPD